MFQGKNKIESSNEAQNLMKEERKLNKQRSNIIKVKIKFKHRKRLKIL